MCNSLWRQVLEEHFSKCSCYLLSWMLKTKKEERSFQMDASDTRQLHYLQTCLKDGWNGSFQTVDHKLRGSPKKPTYKNFLNLCNAHGFTWSSILPLKTPLLSIETLHYNNKCLNAYIHINCQENGPVWEPRGQSTDKYDLFTIYWWLQFTKFRAGLLSPRPPG